MTDDRYKGLSGPERMFREELDAMGATLAAFIFRPPCDWLDEQYGFCITRADGTRVTGVIPWNVHTYPTILEKAKL